MSRNHSNKFPGIGVVPPGKKRPRMIDRQIDLSLSVSIYLYLCTYFSIDLEKLSNCLRVRVRFVDLPLPVATGTKTARLCLQGGVSCSMESRWLPARPGQGSA